MTTSSTSRDTIILSQDDIDRSLKRLTHQLLETNQGSKDLIIVGIYTRGKYLAQRVAGLIEQFDGSRPPLGFLDISLYRDDADRNFKEAQQSQMPGDITGKTVVLVDDVLNSGRTIRAALDALNDYGRPSSVELLVLLDRGHRELPISANYVGKNLPTAKTERVNVRLTEVDGEDYVSLSKA